MFRQLSLKMFCSRCSIFACVCHDGHVHQWSSLWSAVCSSLWSPQAAAATLSQRLMVAAAARCLRTSLLHKNSFFGSWGPLETIFMYLPRVPNYMTVGEKFWDAAKWFPLFKWSKKCSVFEVCSVNMFLLLLHKISKSSKLCPNSILKSHFKAWPHPYVLSRISFQENGKTKMFHIYSVVLDIKYLRSIKYY